ncbi:hypothetical protein [Paenibacillus sp. GP183]|jgi:hypothetical protein|uniref:hypothetical protein n=1 Tax=Paenibacillus sp. GP183 TaxID=1882751 RepID=UPI0008967D5D|nr:hypothetical protein [Paenibacillus sp. GP183]SEB80058.1 hypothetical protein SAMN05443246_1954 [Paenibacillus sp. GP183]
MIGMKVRYQISDINLRINNVTLPKAEDSYVLITAADENNEIIFALSHEQAEFLEYRLYEANRRRRAHFKSATTHSKPVAPIQQVLDLDDEHFTH